MAKIRRKLLFVGGFLLVYVLEMAVSFLLFNGPDSEWWFVGEPGTRGYNFVRLGWVPRLLVLMLIAAVPAFLLGRRGEGEGLPPPSFGGGALGVSIQVSSRALERFLLVLLALELSYCVFMLDPLANRLSHHLRNLLLSWGVDLWIPHPGLRWEEGFLAYMANEVVIHQLLVYCTVFGWARLTPKRQKAAAGQATVT